MSGEGERKLSLVVSHKRQLMRIIIIAAGVLAVVGFVFYKGYTSAAEKFEKRIEELVNENADLQDEIKVYTELDKEIDIALINSEIQEIGELATIEYLYTDVGKFEDPKQLFGKNIPFTTKSFIAKWDGTIKAGIDISKIEVRENGVKKEICILIPEAEILSHEIDNESIETLDEKDGLFNPIKIEDVREFDAKSKEAMEQRAIENGILEKAVENAKDIIYNLVYTEAISKAKYSIVFEVIEKEKES